MADGTKHAWLSRKAWLYFLLIEVGIWLLGLLFTGSVRGAFIAAGAITFVGFFSVVIEALSRSTE
jgi:hypothetical protein